MNTPQNDTIVARIIKEADISSQYEPVAGDCISIANAIHELFGGNLFAVSRRPDKQMLSHAAVEIDDRLYDGRGEVNREILYNEFAESTGNRIERHFWYPDTIDTQQFRGFVFEHVVGDLEDARERLR